MNKKMYQLVAVFIACLLATPIFAKTATRSLSDYVKGQVKTTQLTNPDNTPVEPEPDEELAIPSQQELEKMVSKADRCFLSPHQQDLSDYIAELGLETATGKASPWEKRRAQLYQYVQSSDWHTGKNISDADRSLVETLKTIAFGLIKEVLSLCGWDMFLDRIEQQAINAYENNEQIQYATQMIEADISDALTSEKHTLDELYIKVQHNAFNLLTMNSVDFKKLIKTYPEIEYLFDDLYIFFKWRYDLRTFDPAYKLNENNINVKFRKATRTNSFFAWWELSNMARTEIRNSVEAGKDKPTTFDIADERDSMDFFKTFATRGLYFGRIWNGMQDMRSKMIYYPNISILNEEPAKQK